MTNQPAAISRDADGSIRILWDDDTETCWTPGQLRKACPCATCREKKRASDEFNNTQSTDQTPSSKPRGLPVISAAEARPLRVESMRPVGNYAYNVAFSDGHNSGIFTLPMLRAGFDSTS